MKTKRFTLDVVEYDEKDLANLPEQAAAEIKSHGLFTLSFGRVQLMFDGAELDELTELLNNHKEQQNGD